MTVIVVDENTIGAGPRLQVGLYIGIWTNEILHVAHKPVGGRRGGGRELVS